MCGLSDLQVVRTLRDANGKRREQTRWVAPRLRRVRVRGHVVELTIRARPGQTLTELEAGAERLATTFAAVAHRVRPVSGAGSGCTVAVELVMHDALTMPVERGRAGTAGGRGTDPVGPHPGRWGLVAATAGPAHAGRRLLGLGEGVGAVGRVLRPGPGGPRRHGAAVGCRPETRCRARRWANRLFSTRAYTPADAVDVLRALMAVIDERGARMAGTTRLHQPTVGDPLHVLVIDELAALTAYADLDVRREATRLLSEVLTQGRALGVVVVACVQDPRKDVVAMRGLFTQTVALRLRSSDETVMVLGDGMTHIAPAHRISPDPSGHGVGGRGHRCRRPGPCRLLARRPDPRPVEAVRGQGAAGTGCAPGRPWAGPVRGGRHEEARRRWTTWLRDVPRASDGHLARHARLSRCGSRPQVLPRCRGLRTVRHERHEPHGTPGSTGNALAGTGSVSCRRSTANRRASRSRPI